MTDRLLTVDEAARVLNTKVRFVRRLVEERRIPFHKIGAHVRIAESDVLAYIVSCRVPASGNGRSS